MGSSPSITVEFSPKHTLPTKQPVVEEAKAHCLKWPPSDSASPSHFQKVTPVGKYCHVFNPYHMHRVIF